jgi:hypothetical protein
VVAFIIISMLEGAALTVGIVVDSEHVAVKTIAILVSVVLGMAWVIFVANVMFSSNPEKAIEAELTHGLLSKNKD